MKNPISLPSNSRPFFFYQPLQDMQFTPRAAPYIIIPPLLRPSGSTPCRSASVLPVACFQNMFQLFYFLFFCMKLLIITIATEYKKTISLFFLLQPSHQPWSFCSFSKTRRLHVISISPELVSAASCNIATT